jgi:hypothetical protein
MLYYRLIKKKKKKKNLQGISNTRDSISTCKDFQII